MAKINTKIVMLEGEQGKDGTNIKSVEKSASDGLTDTYTITLTDGSKSSFNVTNGKGISSISKTGAIGLDDIYTITYNDGTTSTFTVTNGKDGAYSVQTQIVPAASIERGETASKAYNVGDFLVKDGILYKVTKAIAEGDALTVGTNIELDTVASELSEIKSNLSDIVQLSLDAVAVGKDEDGNIVYEKTFKGSTLLSGTVLDSTLTVSNLKWIHLVGGCFKNYNTSLEILPYGAYFLVIHLTSKGLVIEYKQLSITMYHFTVQYVLK